MKLYLMMMVGLVLFSTTLSAQLYESQLVGFNQVPYNMQYDSLTGLSYVSGDFTIVNDDTANVAIYDGSSYSLLPKAPIASFRGGSKVPRQIVRRWLLWSCSMGWCSMGRN